MTMNVQARIKNRDEKYRWEDYGDVTHVAAAGENALRYPFTYSIMQTRVEGEGTVFEHEVIKRISYDVKPLRGDYIRIEAKPPKTRDELVQELLDAIDADPTAFALGGEDWKTEVLEAREALK